MGTNTTGSDARDFGQQLMHFCRASFAYNTPNIATDGTIKVGTIPAGSIIVMAGIKVTTAFNAGTTNTINVGTASDHDAVIDELDITASAAEWQVSYRGGDVTFTADTPLYVTYDQTGDAATAGAGEVVVMYIPDNDL